MSFIPNHPTAETKETIHQAETSSSSTEVTRPVWLWWRWWTIYQRAVTITGSTAYEIREWSPGSNTECSNLSIKQYPKDGRPFKRMWVLDGCHSFSCNLILPLHQWVVSTFPSSVEEKSTGKSIRDSNSRPLHCSSRGVFPSPKCCQRYAHVRQQFPVERVSPSSFQGAAILALLVPNINNVCANSCDTFARVERTQDVLPLDHRASPE